MNRAATQDDATVSDRIMDWVRRSISDCEISPGDPLRQDHIARKFKTSKPPVREALRRLQAQDYVDFEANRGFFVKQFTRDEIVDLFEMCAIFEGHAIQTGASRLTRSELLQLDGCIKRIDQTDNLAELLKADGRFHMGLINGIRNATIKTRVEDFHAYFRMYYRAMDVTEVARPVDTYRIIVTDLRQGNVLAAASRIQVHLLDQGRRVSMLGQPSTTSRLLR
jgi:DNA-binding GntR family transcriptional regulator